MKFILFAIIFAVGYIIIAPMSSFIAKYLKENKAILILVHLGLLFIPGGLVIIIISWIIYFLAQKNSSQASQKTTSSFGTSNGFFGNSRVITPSEALIAMFTKIAKSDGVISQDEADAIKELITQLIEEIEDDQERKNARKILVDISKEAKDNNQDIAHYANLFASDRNIPSESKKSTFTMLIAFSIIDGYTTTQEDMLFRVGHEFGFTHSQTREILEGVLGGFQTSDDHISEQEAYEILDSSYSDDVSTIKKKYRQLARKYHPDVIMSKDLDEDFIKLAEEKFKKINSAYEIIKKSRGF